MLTNKRAAKCKKCSARIAAGAGIGIGIRPAFADFYLCPTCYTWSVSAETARKEAKTDLQKIEALVSGNAMAWRIMEVAGQIVWNAGPDAAMVAQEIHDRLSLLPEIRFSEVLAEIGQCGQF
ncbi:MAG TPA: hypothetical protein VIH16_03635 [Bellilinea sp.]